MTILVAIPEMIFREHVCALLRAAGAPCIAAASFATAVHASSLSLTGLITVSEWALPDPAGGRSGLLTLVDTPSLTFMRRVHAHFAQIEAIYDPPLHEYCRAPKDPDTAPERISGADLLTVLAGTGMVAASQ